jgi:glycosyltransferase involved in cell wall biosynthesis
MWGGAEVVFDAFTQAFPNHTSYTSIDFPETRHKPLDTEEVKTSFLQKFPFLHSPLLEIYKFLLPMAFENLTFDKDTTLLISDTTSFAKFVIPPTGVNHLSYIHTPPRFLWGLPPSKKIRGNIFLRFMWNIVIGSTFRIADYLHAQRVHGLIANSQEVAKRIRKYYRREPVAVINPPVYVKKFSETITTAKIEQKNEFLAFGRIEPYKNFDALVKAWPKGYKLTIAGKGSQSEEIKALIKNNPDITFINRYIPDEEKPALFASYKAFLYPNVEDFGIMMVEALSVGTPVITYRAGGGGEIVKHKESGFLLEKLTSESLSEALDWALSFEKSTEQRNKFYEDMLQYDISVFITNIRALATKYRRE